MRTVHCSPLDRSVSVIGFGCASLGSRVSPADGERAMAMALDEGVTWFDTAPPYGDGRAEALLGSFLRGRRDSVVVCTKVGIARPAVGRVKALARSILRPIVKAAPGMRALVRRGRGPAIRTPLTGPAVLASLEDSLRALGTDCIDVLALHDPSMADVANHELLMALESVVASGKARVLSVAGCLDVDMRALAESKAFGVAQFALDPLEPRIGAIRSIAPGAFLVGHSVLGSGALERSSHRIRTSPGLTAALEALGYAGPSAAADILLDLALAENDSGLVLMSMSGPKNIRRNVERASRPIDAAVIRSLTTALQSATGKPQ